MLDFSQEIKLDKKNYSLYRKLQLVLYLLAILTATYLSYLIIFPHKYFSFTFLSSNSSENNIDEPYFSNRKNPEGGKIPANNNLFLNTDVIDDYSSVKVILSLKNNLEKNSPTISTRKSYEAFFYETGDSIGFKDGTLLKNENDYFIISNGQLRKFSSSEILNSLGFSKNIFLEVSREDLQYNPIGENVNDTYPDASLFLIDENFYILENQTLKKFISDQAFFSIYKFEQAIQKDISFLDKYSLSENLAGFPDGTLISNDISVFIISQNKILPIDNPVTFESKGYSWEDVTAVGTDELSIYEKDKLFNIKSSHPNGTILKTIENSNYYLIKDLEKHPLPSESIAKSWLNKNPILVSEKSLETSITCETKQKKFQAKNLECVLPLEKLAEFAGFNYQLSISSKNNIQINSISIDYKKDINMKNLKSFAVKIINEIKKNYAIE